MSSYKEIVTKAVIGKGKKTTKGTYQVTPEETPNTILGCWIINHRFNGLNNNNDVVINGSFDVNVWYSYNNDSKTTVTTKTLNYTDNMKIRLKDNNPINNSEIIVRGLKQPVVQDVTIKNGYIELNVEKELGVEIVGDSIVKVITDEQDEIWEEVLEENDIEINENFIEEKE